jgi:hypothetical protein
MRTVFLDTEFNGFHGHLLSMAICGNGIEPFYEVIDAPVTHPWVSEHVAPFFGKEPIPYRIFEEKLHEYLMHLGHCEVIADWPEDLCHLYRCLCAEGGKMLNFNFTAKLITSGQLFPHTPHNALSDAEALRDWYLLEAA